MALKSHVGKEAGFSLTPLLTNLFDPRTLFLQEPMHF